MRFRWLPRYLSTKLVVLALILTVLGGIIRVVVVLDILKDGIQTPIVAQLNSQASFAATDVNEKLASRRRLLEAMSSQIPAEKLRQPKLLETWLGRRYPYLSQFSLGLGIVPVDGHGIIADFPPKTERRAVDYSDRDWFRVARDQGVFAIGKPTQDDNALVMAIPIKDPQGRVVAVLFGATGLESEGFLDDVQNQIIGDTGGYLLISPRDKIFIAASVPKLRLHPTPLPGMNVMHDRAMDGYRGTGITVNAYGIEELVAIASVPAADWFLVARMPTGEAFRALENARIAAVTRGLSVAVGLVGLMLLLVRYMLRPLKNAAHQMRQIAEGTRPLEPLPIVDDDEIGEMVACFNGLVEKIRENEARMTMLAHHDALTGLPNRYAFLLAAEKTITLTNRHMNGLALCFIDLDGFKPVNDTHGHDFGDKVLREVALRLIESVRKSDIVARFGGDEFVVMLVDMRNTDAIALMAEKLIAKLGQPYRIGDISVSIGASIGIAILPGDGENIDELLALADAAMYEAKDLGKNRFRFASTMGHRPV